MKIVLSGDDFRRLVAGEEIDVIASEILMPATVYHHVPVRIVMADIGFGVMRAAIDQAEHEQSSHQPTASAERGRDGR